MGIAAGAVIALLSKSKGKGRAKVSIARAGSYMVVSVPMKCSGGAYN